MSCAIVYATSRIASLGRGAGEVKSPKPKPVGRKNASVMPKGGHHPVIVIAIGMKPKGKDRGKGK